MKGSLSKAESSLRQTADQILLAEASDLARQKNAFELGRGSKTRIRRILAETRKRGLISALEPSNAHDNDGKDEQNEFPSAMDLTGAVSFLFRREADSQEQETLMLAIRKKKTPIVNEFSDIAIYTENGNLFVMGGDAAEDVTQIYQLTPAEVQRAANSVAYFKRYVKSESPKAESSVRGETPYQTAMRHARMIYAQ